MNLGKFIKQVIRGKKIALFLKFLSFFIIFQLVLSQNFSIRNKINLEQVIIYTMNKNCKACFTEELIAGESNPKYSFRECSSDPHDLQRWNVRLFPDRMTYKLQNVKSSKIISSQFSDRFRVIPANGSGLYFLLPEEKICLYNGGYYSKNSINFIFDNNNEMFTDCSKLDDDLKFNNIVMYYDTSNVLPKERYNVQLIVMNKLTMTDITATELQEINQKFNNFKFFISSNSSMPTVKSTDVTYEIHPV